MVYRTKDLTLNRWFKIATGGDGPTQHRRLKSNAPQIGGDSLFELAVMGRQSSENCQRRDLPVE
jgi:hypothetical protein